VEETIKIKLHKAEFHFYFVMTINVELVIPGRRPTTGVGLRGGPAGHLPGAPIYKGR
jgi:hypothetical protein